jgi:hypothetical protein
LIRSTADAKNNEDDESINSVERAPGESVEHDVTEWELYPRVFMLS